MTHSPDSSPHRYVDQSGIGLGDDPVCEKCGVRKSQNINECRPKPVPQQSLVKAEYDPFG